MLQIHNNSPFRVELDVFPDPTGVDTAYVSVKATFCVDGQVKVNDEQQPIYCADVYRGEPGRSSIRYPGDRHPCKPATDVLLIGSACSKGGAPVTELLVTLAVAELRRSIRVVGDRFWRHNGVLARVTAPEPFVSMPLVYERAFGGVVERGDGRIRFEPRNPVGCGFAGGRSDAEMKGSPLPNLEEPDAPYLAVRDRSAPTCFAAVSPDWLPRRTYAGTYDERWQNYRAPYLPDDFDPRFFQAAPVGLVASSYLRGGELVEVSNASPAGLLRFSLPMCRFSVAVFIRGVSTVLQPNLETIVLEPDVGRLCMLWRASIACDKRVLDVSQAIVGLDEMRLD